MSDNGSLVHARDLVKRFGDLVAVDGIDLDVRRGEAFGFLGPNREAMGLVGTWVVARRVERLLLT